MTSIYSNLYLNVLDWLFVLSNIQWFWFPHPIWKDINRKFPLLPGRFSFLAVLPSWVGGIWLMMWRSSFLLEGSLEIFVARMRPLPRPFSFWVLAMMMMVRPQQVCRGGTIAPHYIFLERLVQTIHMYLKLSCNVLLNPELPYDSTWNHPSCFGDLANCYLQPFLNSFIRAIALYLIAKVNYIGVALLAGLDKKLSKHDKRMPEQNNSILHSDVQDLPKEKVFKDFINTSFHYKHWNVLYFPKQEDSFCLQIYICYLIFTITVKAGFIFPSSSERYEATSPTKYCQMDWIPGLSHSKAQCSFHHTTLSPERGTDKWWGLSSSCPIASGVCR